MNDALTKPRSFNTAVLLLAFNRPDTTLKVFEAIRKAKPPRLYVSCDGPRKGREGEAERVARVHKITTDVDLDLKGLLSPFGFLPRGNMESAINTALASFVEYSQRYDDEAKIIDDLYREILHRPVDLLGLQYYSPLLQEEKITVDEIRETLKNSEEFKTQLFPDEYMTLDELSENTKKQVNDLYFEILGRAADPEGLQIFGSLIEIGKMTTEELRNALLDSEEYKIHVLQITPDDEP